MEHRLKGQIDQGQRPSDDDDGVSRQPQPLQDEEEILGNLRPQGMKRLEDVNYAFMEMDGRISVILKEEGKRPQDPPEEKVL